MGNNIDRFRKRHRKRKMNRKHHRPPVRTATPPSHNSEEVDRLHPLFSKEAFLFKILLSATLFLGVAIVFKQPNESLVTVREVIQQSFEQDFQFATVANWYETQFGKPLALLPEQQKDRSKQPAVQEQAEEYAVPATGRIVEPFTNDGKGVIIETDPAAMIDCIKDGFVVYIGERDHLGKTVIVQHHDGSESWYGHLHEVDVALYDYIKSGDPIGKSSHAENDESGLFYFALKRGESFIDPIQVISFD